MLSTFSKSIIVFIIGLISSWKLLVIISFFVLLYFFLNKKTKVETKSVLILFLVLFSGSIYKKLHPINQDHLIPKTILLESATFTISEIKKTSYGSKINGFFNQNSFWLNAIIYNFTKSSFEKGDQIEFNKIELEKLQKEEFEYAFNYNDYLLNKGIFYKGYLDSTIQIKKTASKDLSTNFISSYKTQITSHIKHFVPKHYSIVEAICLGDQDGLNPENKSLFIKNGIAHIMAVSGLHIGIVFLLIIQFLRLFRLDENDLGIMVALLLVWLFIAITGFPISGIRSGIMISVYSVFKSLKRKPEKFHIVCFSAIIILLWNPNDLYSVGFQLSFGALLGILYCSKPILNLWKPKTKLSQYFWEIIAISLSVQITTAPLSIYYFHSFPVHFLLTNILAIPFAFLILSLFILMLIFQFSTFASVTIGKLVNSIIDVFLHFLESISLYASLTLENIFLTKPSLIAYYSSLSILLIFGRNYSLLKKWGISISLCFITFTYSHFQESNKKVLYVSEKRGLTLICKNGFKTLFLTENKEFKIDYFHPILKNRSEIKKLDKISEIRWGKRKILINPNKQLVLENTIHKPFIYSDQIHICRELLSIKGLKIYVPSWLKRKMNFKQLIALDKPMTL